MAIYPPNQTTPPKTSGSYLWNWLGSPIKKFAAAIQPYLKGGGVTEVTYPQLQALVSSSSLVPGVTYKITGFNKNKPGGGPTNPNNLLPVILYDDGTNSGVTIYMQALSTTEMATSGYGEFYNPKYSDGNSYNNTDGTGLYQIWDGDNPDPLQIPAYSVGDVVFWGGYAWENLLGNIGTANNIFELDPVEWEKLPYSNTTWYELVTDEIKVDWENDLVIERYNPENKVLVSFNADYLRFFYSVPLANQLGNRSPISAMAWGLYSKRTPEQIGLPNFYYGITNIKCDNSWLETVNFKGNYLIKIECFSSTIYNNYYGKNCAAEDLIFTDYAYMNDMSLRTSLLGNPYLYLIHIIGQGGIGNIILSNGSSLSSIYMFNDCYFDTATLNQSNVYNISMRDWSGIYNIQLTNNSFLVDIALDQSAGWDFDNTGLLSGKTLNGIAVHGGGAGYAPFAANISAATVIFNPALFTKTMSINQSGQGVLSYINGSNNLVITSYTT